MNSLEQLEAYREGYLWCLWLFAHYKDGIQYVGSCGKTYQNAKAEFEAEYEQKIQDLKIAGRLR